MRIEKEAIAIVENPVRFRKRRLSALNRLLHDIDAPVSLFVNRRTRIAQHVPDVSAEVENVFPAPVAFAQLNREERKLTRLGREKCQFVSSLVEELAIQIVGPAAIVEKRRKKHDHQDTSIYPDVCFSAHEPELKRSHQRTCALARFLFEVRERVRGHRGPHNWTFITNADDVDLDLITVPGDRAFSNPARVTISVQPASIKFLQAAGVSV